MYPGGLWYNELGSRMNLNVSGSDVWGWYYSKVGQAEDTYDVSGRINKDPYPYGQALGWTVAWNNPYLNSHSVTSWSGQYQTTGGREEIIALWLLTRETRPESDWESTQVGQDVFTRSMPSPEEIEANRTRLGRSHPSGAETSA